MKTPYFLALSCPHLNPSINYRKEATVLLSEAREILDLNIKEAGKDMPPDTRIALIMSVSALARVELTRLTPVFDPHTPLKEEDYTHPATD